MSRASCFVLLFTVFMFATDAFAGATSNADVIRIRKVCDGSESNCFDDVPGLDGLSNALDDASAWMNTVRHPNSAAPLVWDIGPGEFVGTLHCVDSSFVSYRGRGPGVTTIVGGSLGSYVAVSSQRCFDINYQDLTVFSEGSFTTHFNSGTSTWTNTSLLNDLDSVKTGTSINGNAWYDDCGPNEPQGVHYFFGSKMESRGPGGVDIGLGKPAALTVLCAQLWIYGSDILRTIDEPSSNPFGTVISLAKYATSPLNGDVRVFGSTIRMNVGPGAGSSIFAVAGVTVRDGGTFHSHGNIINVSVDPSITSPSSVIAISVGDDGTAHTPDTAFNLNPGGGSPVVKRLAVFGNGKVASPYVWEARTTPPVSSTELGSFASATGQDMFVEIDCSSAGDCDPATNLGASEPHLMIYSASHCGGTDPWFDTVTGRCRNDVATPIEDLQAQTSSLETQTSNIEAIAADHEIRITVGEAIAADHETRISDLEN